MASIIQHRRGEASEWSSSNPILNAGEFGFETDTNKLKIGNGTTNWNDLDYFHKTPEDVRASVLPLPLEQNSTTISKSDGTAILSESSGIATLDNVTLGLNVLGGGSGGGSANTAYYRLTLENNNTELQMYKADPGDVVTLNENENYLMGTGTFTIQNNNLILAVV
tara:strand:+ start:638 stop:1135 length:498 start_codon:yes stop_codon:yes gene_type:complete